MNSPSIRTERLLLRPWRAADRAPYAAMNADPRVMEFFPSVLTAEESDLSMARMDAHFQLRGFGFWAVEIPGIDPFAGILGLGVPRFDAPIMPCVEIGWRLAARHWGKGYATEGALASLVFAFEKLGLNEVVAFTVPDNVRSRRVMEKIGMRHEPERDFDHPLVPEGNRRRRHVFYRVEKAGWIVSSRA